MAENAAIKMKIKQTAGGQTDTTEMFTRGEYRPHKGAYYIDYDETEATGYDGCHVQLCIKDEAVTMVRTGAAFSSLVFQLGERHYCHYDTGFGDCMVGITTNALRQVMADNGGEIMLKYTIDVNGGLVTENEIKINVSTKEQ